MTTAIGSEPSFEALLRDPPRPHVHDGQHVSMSLPADVLRFIRDQVDDSCTTLETGCGFSTVVFGLTGAQHTVVAPVGQELEYLKQYCRDRGIPIESIRFLEGPSQRVLPALEPVPLDLVLIDGSHGFPAPYLDWFYTAGALRIGGHVIVDDTWVWSCQILRDFLVAQPQWRLVKECADRTAIFRKLEDGAEVLEWNQQPLVATAGRMKWIDGQVRYRPPFRATAIGRAVADLRNGDFGALRRKLANRLLRRP